MDAAEQESVALLTYVLGRRPSAALKDRYRRAIAQQSAAPIGLPNIVTRWPALLRMLEPLGGPRTGRRAVLKSRLNIAMTLVETSTEGVDRLRRPLAANRIAVLLRLLGALTLDALMLPARLVSPLLWR
jgi:hypothetical protein